jgi:copper chaperone NosL
MMKLYLRLVSDIVRNAGSPGLILLSAIMLLFTLTACGAQARAEPEPPDIYYGEDVCEFCGMIVSEERYAAGYILADGREHVFDDIGDMVQHYLATGENVTAFFVHDHASRMWIRAETAHYVLSTDLPTPMLSGVAAFSSQAEAMGFSAELGGETLTFEELLTHYRENPPMTTHHSDSHHH